MDNAKSLLTHKMARFVEEYPKDFNGAAAAIRAGYSKKTAKEAANRVLTNVHVQAALKAEIESMTERNHITQDRVIQEYGRVAFSNIKDFIKFTTDGVVNMKASDELTREQAACIAEVSETTGKVSSFKFKLYNKLDALDSLAKYFGMFTDKGLNPDDDGVQEAAGRIPAAEQEAEDRLQRMGVLH